MELKIFNVAGQPVGQVSLEAQLWGGKVNTPVLLQALAMYRTNVRANTASTKTRGHVSGGGKKPWKQKHTGRARAGSIRSPLWRHGGIVFGPHPHARYYRLPQTMRRKALLESLKGKVQDEELVMLDRLAADTPKTKPFAGLAKAFAVGRKSLIVLNEPSSALVKSLRNLAGFELRSAQNLNAFDVLNAQKILVTKSAFERLQERVRGDAAGQ
ncbi:MAG: 50S ribosomal protein L4 [Candidatus Omnitrophica bacterium]|nr:50S ribosomal protein L4 [Candidatus Omnitrophota bacterium]